ncbi:Esterase FE4 [Orchesella cincta]|uniref:Esterase FE4 n=1 Tax=Orchesella cincta TaxID=48709 RepID=A0A1D2N887_ORCCI|nr:Esterase FE4 [Orchesella cincta]
MLVTVGMFLFNLLCGLVPCDPQLPKPEILDIPRDVRIRARNIDNRIVEPIVKLPIGIVEGYRMKSMNGRDFFAFEGIPYGESTGGSRRWKPPVPKRPWRGVRQAKKPGSDCLQMSVAKLFRVYGSEDCLYLNVYTPQQPYNYFTFAYSTILKHFFSFRIPIRVLMVYRLSFSSMEGSGSEYGPAYLLNEDIVLITLNYRLGVLGFFSTGDHHMPGNYGAHLHLISNKTRNYFSSVVSSSGTAFQTWGLQSPEKLKYFSNRLAQRFGCQNEDSYELVQCMKRMDSNLLAAAQLSLFDWFPFPPVLFSPTIEPPHPDAFLTVSPEEAYRTGVVAKKPFIMGVTKDEGKTAMMSKLLSSIT